MTFFPVRAKEVAMADGGREGVTDCSFTESNSRESFVDLYAVYLAQGIPRDERRLRKSTCADGGGKRHRTLAVAEDYVQKAVENNRQTLHTSDSTTTYSPSGYPWHIQIHCSTVYARR